MIGKIAKIGIIIGITIAAAVAIYMKRMEFSISQNFESSSKSLDNPARGMYVQLAVQNIFEQNHSGQSSSRENISVLKNIRERGIRLVLIAFDIFEFRESDISEEKLSQLDYFLTKLEELGLQGIFRAAYGFDVKEKNDADSMERIDRHIQQIAPVLNAHKNVIYCVQAGFFGPWGEWHSSDFLKGEQKIQICNRNQLLTWLLEALDSSVAVAVRRPCYIRDAIEAGIDNKRFVYHDDGLLGSDTDLGTYCDENYTREEELEWLQACPRGENGGEMPIKNNYTAAVNAVKEFQKIQLSYLNADYNQEVLTGWQQETFFGENAYQYINNHLGYRFYVPQLQYKETWRGCYLEGSFFNEGFAPVTDGYAVSVILEEQTNGIEENMLESNAIERKEKTIEKKIEEIPIETVILGELKGEKEITFKVEVPKKFRGESFRIGIKIYDTENKSNQVELSNQDNSYENGINYLVQVIRK